MMQQPKSLSNNHCVLDPWKVTLTKISILSHVMKHGFAEKEEQARKWYHLDSLFALSLNSVPVPFTVELITRWRDRQEKEERRVISILRRQQTSFF